MTKPYDPHGFVRPPSICGNAGYKKPPKEYRWKKGVSGNPAGRPKNKKNRDIIELMIEELSQEVTIQENGKNRKLTKREVIAKQMVHGAMAGDKKCIEAVRKIDEFIYQERNKIDQPVGGVLLVGAMGMPTPEGYARGLTYEEELAEHQAPYRNAIPPPTPKDKEKEK